MRIITGCSRSGTSFVCQLLNELGADFGSGDELIAADEWNVRGYFENRAVTTLNHQLLFGRASNPRIWTDILWPDNTRLRIRKLLPFLLSPILARDRAIRKRGTNRAAQITALSQASRDKVVKDPRFCYLMTPWCEYGEIDSVLFVLRHPWEAAHSISKQTKLPLKLTYAFWTDSIRRFWDTPPPVPVATVDFNALISPDTSIDATQPLFEFLDIEFDPTVAEAAIATHLEPDLPNSKANDKHLPRKIAYHYEKLKKLGKERD